MKPGIIGVTVACSLTLGILLPSVVGAQGIHGGGGKSASRIEGSHKFLPIPYINYDRSIGFQAGALPMVLFNPVEKDTISPSSIVGLFGMYTTNDTWFLAAFGMFYLDEDNWRVAAAAGTGDYNFQFFMDAPVSSWIPYQTEMDVAFIRLQRRLYRRLYGGVSYVHLNFATTFDTLPVQEQTTLNGVGLNLELDHRSSVYYPRGGFQTGLNYFTYPEAFGNESSSQKMEFEYNRYVSTRRDRDVIAGRLFGGAGLGDLSFNQQFVVGQGQDIRGYTQGEFRGNYMLALQGEYRWNFQPRLGLVGFAAVATIFDGVNPEDDGKLLPGVGAGVRFTADVETHMNVGMDLAVGRGDWGIYFRIGESF